MNLQAYGYYPVNPNLTNFISARIVAVHRGRYEIVCDKGAGFAQLKTSAYRAQDACVPTVGDFVLLQWQENGDSVITQTLPRTSFFSRLDPSSAGHAAQAVAANFDFIFILQPLGSKFHLRGLERYLTLAWQSGGTPVVLLTKADTAQDHTAQIRAAEQLAVGAEVYAVSAKTGEGIDALSAYLKPTKTVVLLGPSGAGKSTLVNALAGCEKMETGAVRESDSRGRHTTSHRQLILLPCGAMVIDTPGMRELGMWDAESGLSQGYADIEAYFGHCKFSDCRHQSEPGCAVKAAIRSGALTQERWESYRKLQQEARFTGDKAAYLREKQQWHKSIVKQQRQQSAAPDYRVEPCRESFVCKVCGAQVTPEAAGSHHRNHCPHCLSSLHVDRKPGDRASLCQGVMDPIGVWVRKNGEWAIIHRCRDCGTLSSNRIAADDNSTLLMSIAMKPLAQPPFMLWGTEGNASSAHP